MPKPLDEICCGIAASGRKLPEIFLARGLVPLLALLELPYSEIRARLVPGLVAAGFARDEAEAVSLRNLVIFSFDREVGTYWGDLGLTWLEQGLEMDSGVAEALQAASQDVRFSQSTRHRARKLLAMRTSGLLRMRSDSSVDGTPTLLRSSGSHRRRSGAGCLPR